MVSKEFDTEFEAMVSGKTIGSTGIRVKEFIGTWHVIHEFSYKHQVYFLLEHSQHGDETASIIIDGNGKLFLDSVYQISDFYEFVDDMDHYLRYIENYNN